MSKRGVKKVFYGIHERTWERIDDGDVPHPSDVIEAVAIATGVPAVEFMGRRSVYRLTKCRYMIGAILYVDYGVPINDVARVIRRVRATATYGVRSIVGSARTDTALRAELDRARAIVAGRLAKVKA